MYIKILKKCIFQEIMKEYGVTKCMYGHLHGYGHSLVKEGIIDGIEYIMVGCDYNNFELRKINKEEIIV